MQIGYEKIKELFTPHGVYFTPCQSTTRLHENSVIEFEEKTSLERGIGILLGSYLPKLGMGSYTW